MTRPAQIYTSWRAVRDLVWQLLAGCDPHLHSRQLETACLMRTESQPCRWLDADSPWQLLAVCMEIAAALRSGDPRTYLSRMPVHQDGSCNGLQHYAALGRDAWGGSAVNLTPSDRHQVLRLVHAREVDSWTRWTRFNGRNSSTCL